MKRRKTRTILTFLTLLLLTFTVLSFTSISTGMRFNQIQRDNEGLYEGILIRSKAWNPMEDSVLEYALSNFGQVGVVAPRSWYSNKSKAHIKMKDGIALIMRWECLDLRPKSAKLRLQTER